MAAKFANEEQLIKSVKKMPCLYGTSRKEYKDEMVREMHGKGCNNINFARRTECNKCGAGKNVSSQVIKQGGSEIGKNFASKSKGLFSAEDWQCSKCSNINWARRMTCNICKAPKLKTQENRTGIGGGFMERDNVEYVERDDSDDEYDEFGRKKKKFRGQIPPSKTEIESLEEKDRKESDFRKYEDEEEEDEDEDEDDDGDFDASKYDLSASDDDEDNDYSKAVEKSSSADRKRHRSSSRSSKSSSSYSSSSSSSSRSRSYSRSSSSRSRSRSPKRSRR